MVPLNEKKSSIATIPLGEYQGQKKCPLNKWVMLSYRKIWDGFAICDRASAAGKTVLHMLAFCFYFSDMLWSIYLNGFYVTISLHPN